VKGVKVTGRKTGGARLPNSSRLSATLLRFDNRLDAIAPRNRRAAVLSRTTSEKSLRGWYAIGHGSAALSPSPPQMAITQSRCEHRSLFRGLAPPEVRPFTFHLSLFTSHFPTPSVGLASEAALHQSPITNHLPLPPSHFSRMFPAA